ncbi:MAG: YbaB/EbfC family nucleoid-associated protein [Parachlamydiales bacterium]|nr:YbaB/EbfC family nucleoid-associated protein [Parachlamydiales bacterium]
MKKMLEQVSTLQEKLDQTEITGSAGGGAVSITLSGKKELKKISIQKECIDPNDIGGLEDLILAAYNDAHAQLEKNLYSNLSLPF